MPRKRSQRRKRRRRWRSRFKPTHPMPRRANMMTMSAHNEDYLSSLGKVNDNQSMKASYRIQATDANHVMPMVGNESSTLKNVMIAGNVE